MNKRRFIVAAALALPFGAFAEAGYYAGQDARLAAPLIREPFTRGQLGALMPKGSGELLAFVNAFLAEEKASGRIDELAGKYIYTENEEAEEAA